MKAETEPWIRAPKKCDICKAEFKAGGIYFDAKTRQGLWAFQCPSCFKSDSGALGLGRGQKYQIFQNFSPTLRAVKVVG